MPFLDFLPSRPCVLRCHFPRGPSLGPSSESNSITLHAPLNPQNPLSWSWFVSLSHTQSLAFLTGSVATTDLGVGGFKSLRAHHVPSFL